MPGTNSGVKVNDPVVVAAFRAALLHQGLVALLIFAALGLAWVSVRLWLPAAVRDGAPAQAPGTLARGPAEPAGRRLLRIGFGLLWLLDGSVLSCAAARMSVSRAEIAAPIQIDQLRRRRG